jgi:hypothetical protein
VPVEVQVEVQESRAAGVAQRRRTREIARVGRPRAEGEGVGRPGEAEERERERWVLRGRAPASWSTPAEEGVPGDPNRMRRTSEKPEARRWTTLGARNSSTTAARPLGASSSSTQGTLRRPPPPSAPFPSSTPPNSDKSASNSPPCPLLPIRTRTTPTQAGKSLPTASTLPPPAALVRLPPPLCAYALRPFRLQDPTSSKPSSFHTPAAMLLPSLDSRSPLACSLDPTANASSPRLLAPRIALCVLAKELGDGDREQTSEKVAVAVVEDLCDEPR